ncbi:hypothetical protein H6A24_02105 [Bacteroides caecicola]|uniref:Cyclophilin-like domain-containing protein n=2 Tax=Bacteroidaceae TaxID=815 RepID=A0ABS2F4Z3_9BACE|nr:hypothetical protein [Phocaeicola faecium]MBM6805297.1 hypothetical protein [Bacteroides caecicola]
MCVVASPDINTEVFSAAVDYSCIVLFYETFSSGYSHTRLGQIDNPEGLAAALGDGYVSVRFAITKSTDRNI